MGTIKADFMAALGLLRLQESSSGKHLLYTSLIHPWFSVV